MLKDLCDCKRGTGCVCACIILISNINNVYFILAVPVATRVPSVAFALSAAVPSTSSTTAEYIDETGESHQVEVFSPIDVPDAEEVVTVKHSYSAQSPSSTSTTQPNSCPSSRPASCPPSRPASRPASCHSARHPTSRHSSATRGGASHGDDKAILVEKLQVQRVISERFERLEHHFQDTATSLRSIAASMQILASQTSQA